MSEENKATNGVLTGVELLTTRTDLESKFGKSMCIQLTCLFLDTFLDWMCFLIE